MVDQKESITDDEGNVIVYLPTFLSSVSNLRYSILYHHGPKSKESYLSSRVQHALSLEPNDITKDLNNFCSQTTSQSHKTQDPNMTSLQILSDSDSESKRSNDDRYYCEQNTDVNIFSPLSQLNQISFTALSQDERITNFLKYIFSDDTKLIADDDETKVSYRNLDEKFKTSNCLNLNNFISDDAMKQTSVVNNYLDNNNQGNIKDQVDIFAKE